MALSAPLQTFGVSIAYEVQDLADVNPGQDLQKYTYRVSGFDFQRHQGFTILFDPALFSDLDVSPAPPNADWDIITGEPASPFPGIYDALSVVAAGSLASLADAFELSFVWLGTGVPGVQEFEINEFDDDLNFLGTLASGFTVPGGPLPPPLPEGGSVLALFALGVLSLLGFKQTARR